MIEILIEIQRSIRGALGADIAAFASNRDWAALFLMLPFGILFGAAHAMTPGHSKSILVAYAMGKHVSPSRAFLTSTVLAVCHIAMAVLLAFVFTSLVQRTIVGAGRAPALEWTSRGLLLAIGVWLLIRAFWRPHMGHGEGNLVGMAAGLVPCPLTLFMMTYAVALGVPEAGFVFALAMLLGVLAVLSAVGLATVYFRSSFVAWIEHNGREWRPVARWVDVLAALLLIGIALYELVT